MRRLRFLLLVRGTFFLMAFSLAAYAGDAAPKIHMERTSIDYGEIPAGKVVNPRFPFKNIGNATLKITNQLFLGKFIQAKALEGCWPPRVVVGSTTLRSGEESFIKTTFTMNKGMGGPHHFLIVLETNDPHNRKIELHIKANFTSEWRRLLGFLNERVMGLETNLQVVTTKMGLYFLKTKI